MGSRLAVVDVEDLERECYDTDDCQCIALDCCKSFRFRWNIVPMLDHQFAVVVATIVRS